MTSSNICTFNVGVLLRVLAGMGLFLYKKLNQNSQLNNSEFGEGSDLDSDPNFGSLAQL